MEPAGNSPASTTAGQYDLDGRLSFILQEGEFFGIDKADYGLVPVHCEVWQGFIFVNLAKQPTQTLTEFLGPMITAIDYPFEKLTERYYYRGDIRSNWKVFLDAFQEFYHPPILHGHQNPVMSAVRLPGARVSTPCTSRSTARIAWVRRAGAPAGSCRRRCTTPSSG